ncbi:hypothetical protein [Pontibacter fetidus]|uniref:Uncharacterized protein n=1 Tax=Pontibacter fetidus TaxID=2700082 RepID=A0A6B2H4J5_9BACT|nr:hypothetical protein [Pontibacter fetidus]NDK57381.1 hypothetical protein [Pontibacter fetidus]
MKNFEDFVYHVVTNWRIDKKAILESAGLSGLSNREYGDIAEKYVKKKIENLSPTYSAFLSNGSQSPADLISYARRNGYWHIMLIQVKSSGTKDKIHELNQEEKKVFDEFAKYVKKEFLEFPHFDSYADKPIIISTGYAGVLRIAGEILQHRLVNAKPFKIFKINMATLDMDKIKTTIRKAHTLNIK